MATGPCFRLLLWSVHLIGYRPRASTVLNDGGELHVRPLAAHVDLHLIVVCPGLQIFGRLGCSDRPGIDLLGKDDRLRIHRDFLEARNFLGRAALLIPSSQVLRKEFFRRHEQRQIVDRPGKAMTLIGSENVLDREATVA